LNRLSKRHGWTKDHIIERDRSPGGIARWGEMRYPTTLTKKTPFEEAYLLEDVEWKELTQEEKARLEAIAIETDWHRASMIEKTMEVFDLPRPCAETLTDLSFDNMN